LYSSAPLVVNDQANSITITATAMTTSAMNITTSTLDMRHIAHRQCTSP
jgi:hypothetical protein